MVLTKNKLSNISNFSLGSGDDDSNSRAEKARRISANTNGNSAALLLLGASCGDTAKIMQREDLEDESTKNSSMSVESNDSSLSPWGYTAAKPPSLPAEIYKNQCVGDGNKRSDTTTVHPDGSDNNNNNISHSSSKKGNNGLLSNATEHDLDAPIPSLGSTMDSVRDSSSRRTKRAHDDGSGDVGNSPSSFTDNPSKRPATDEDWQQVVVDGINQEDFTVDDDDISSSYDFSSSDEEDEQDDYVDKHDNSAQKSKSFNMMLLRDSIEKGGPALEQVQGKDVVLVMGKTGTGKSTLIQGIAGKKLRLGFYTTTTSSSSGSNHNTIVRKEVFEAEDALPGFEIGHAKVSQTKHIRCYLRRPEVVYLDSPGFEDTNGHEIDIATSIMLSEVAKRAKSLRFVVLINYVSLLEDRGGSMRDLVRFFIKTFVRDFSSAKKSFLFLFSHTNEIKEIADNDAKKKREGLRGEIIRTMEGTKDEDVRTVLDFMSKSIKKNYPFCDIFHPVTCNYSKLTRNIERHLLPLQQQEAGHSCCSLSMASQLKLEGNLHRELQTLRLELAKTTTTATNCDSSMERAKDTRKTLNYLASYLDDVGFVRQAISECQSIFQKHIDAQKDIITAEVKRGTSPDLAFTDRNIANLKAAVSRLVALSDVFPSETDMGNLWPRLAQEVLSFQKQLLLGEAGAKNNLNGVHLMLEKLQRWSQGFTEFSPLYSEVIRHISGFIQHTIGSANAFFSGTRPLLSATKEQLSKHVRHVGVLKSICDNQNNLSLHHQLGVVVDSAVGIYDFVLKRMKAALLSWTTATFVAMKETTLLLSDFHKNNDMLPEIATRAYQIETLSSVFEEESCCVFSPLTEFILSIRTCMENIIVERFVDISSKLKEQDSQEEFEKKDLDWIREASNLFGSMKGSRWRRVNQEYIAVLEHTKVNVKSILRILEDDSKLTNGYGFKNGSSQGENLARFTSFQWLDGFLQPGERFVENCVVAHRRTYQERIDLVKSDVSSTFLFDKNQPFETSVSVLKRLLPELSQIADFGSVAPYMQHWDFNSVVRSKLGKHTEILAEKTKNRLVEWNTALQDKDTSNFSATTRDLDKALNEITHLRELGSEYDTVLQTVNTEIIQAFAAFDKSVQEVFDDSNEDYQKQADYLSLVEAIDGFRNAVVLRCPKFDKLKEHVRNLVSSDSQKIETMIMETSEWDRIDDNLKQFEEKATLVDKFTSNEATSRLRSLRQLRDQKEIKVDDLLVNLIQKRDFIGIREFLEPLAKSKDQMKKQKFQSCLRMICSSIKEIISNIHSLLNSNVNLENTREVMKGLEVLKQAQAELNQYLNDHLILKNDHLKLTSEIDKIKNRINGILKKILGEIKVAAEKPDYASLVTHKELSTMFAEQAHDYLRIKTKDLLKLNMDKYDDALASVPRYLDMFFESNFKKGEHLVRALSSLKEACDCDAASEVVSELYQQTTKELIQKLTEYLQQMEIFVSKSQCYDDAIAIVNNLDVQMMGGLKNHVLPSQFRYDCKALLVGWQSEKRAHDCKMDFGFNDAESKLDLWAKQLDELHPSNKFSRYYFQWVNNTNYEKLCGKLSGRVADVFLQGKTSLQTSDYMLVNECISLLALVAQKVGKHVTIAASKLKNLEGIVLNAFVKLCKQEQQILASGKIVQEQFECFFNEYHSFVLRIPRIIAFGRAMKEFELTNQLIFEMLNREISELKEMVDSEREISEVKGMADLFDFPVIKTKVSRVRALGGFIADQSTLFHEEVKRCEQIEVDKWLGKLSDLCFQYFGCGRDLSRIKYYAILGIPPSATKSEIKRAYREKAKIFHPDKNRDSSRNGGGDDGAMFREIKEALDELENAPVSSTTMKPFDDLLKSIRDLLRTTVRKYLIEQRYELVEQVLFKLRRLDELDDLVVPRLDSIETQNDIKGMVKCHVEKVKVEVDSNWSERKYRALNENITDLKLMETNFKAYSDIFPTSWNNGIVKKIENEIESLGQRARGYLQKKKIAKEKFEYFRRDFIMMGFVLIELPPFKDFTKDIMCNVLESCLDSDWGYSYLFDLGLSLQKGEENENEDAKRVGQVIVSEFSHFKEVLTMVWNEETTQKPVEDTVCDIRGVRRTLATAQELVIEKEQLLESFRVFDAQYKLLLGEYIKPEADLNVLVHQTKTFAQKLKPLSCSDGWGVNTKKNLPYILAGVFAVFTVLKSGASYNRIEAAGASEIGQMLLKKPHNIQILTLLCMFGCGSPSSKSLESQLMEIRTGEGKSIILGAAAAVLGLLGFKVRCVCYSDYLSSRDYNLFEDVFQYFNLIEDIKYSKITTLSEDTTAAKGDIRCLTTNLLRGGRVGGMVAKSCEGDNSREVSNTTNEILPSSEEILLVDEVDVFFGSEFYGQTYNQVVQLREPEITDILKKIWKAHVKGGQRLRIGTVKKMQAYASLVQKFPRYEFLLDNEIALMLDQVRRVDDEPYYLDEDRIGYKVMDTVSFEATYGYRTIFAYLKEADNGNLKNKEATLEKVLAMPISCGQFSYANISPSRILGVSGTLDAMGQYEKNVMAKYGITTFMYIPSVYGKSNFEFDRAGAGIYIESSTSDFFYKIADEIKMATVNKRAVIVFFRDNKRMNEFTSSAFYRKLGRHKSILTEDMKSSEKEFVIQKAATSGQITISLAVFGRGTDFFCKDETVQKNGGVHVIQTFLSVEASEEIQIQGRTARQGKKGSYQLILLESDLEEYFGLSSGKKDTVPKAKLYDWLQQARGKVHNQNCIEIETNLVDASKKDRATHSYFDALLAGNHQTAHDAFKDIYLSMKKSSLPAKMDLDLGFVIDVTGSMGPYAHGVLSTIRSLVEGGNSVLSRIKSKFAEIEFNLHFAVMGFRDFDDESDQFRESLWQNSHFTHNSCEAIRFVDSIIKSPSGGGDLAEDHLGAINRCANWNHSGDWTSPIKFMIHLTDAPAHGLLPASCVATKNTDNYSIRHPQGLTASTVVADLISKGIDLFMCSFNPTATSRTEEELSRLFLDNPDNTEDREVTVIPMVPKTKENGKDLIDGESKHIIFVLDESGSMSCNWAGVVVAYNNFISRRRQNQSESDLVSVVQFDSSSRITVQSELISQAPSRLGYRGGGTRFYPAALHACQLASSTRSTPLSHVPVIVFMSDGEANDSSHAAAQFSALNDKIHLKYKTDLELHVIAFGTGANKRQLQEIAGASCNGKVHTSADTAELSNVFVNIASGQDVASFLEAEIGKRISEAVTDRLSLEYLA